MKNKSRKVNKKKLRKSPVFLIALFNFLIIILIAIYFIYLRFVPYKTITYDGYAVSGKDLVNNLLNPSFDVDQSIEALEVKDQDEIYKNYKSYYVGAAKERNINLDYPIYVNDKLALYNLSKDMKLITSDLKTVDGYEGFTITSGALYDEHTMERADYNDYILMKNSDNMYINTKEMKIETSSKKYTIKMNSVINFTKGFITYYTLEDGKFIYGKILDIDEASIIKINDFNCKYTYKELMIALGIMKEEIKTPEENKVEENKVEENETEENKINEQKPNINKKPDNSKKPDDGDNNGENTIKWQKPKVSCTKFIANIYSASTEVTIDDPSGAISKAVTFNFYKDDELSFRASTNISETLKVIKLLPNTKYTVIGTYQYTDESGEIYEVKFTTQEFKTAEADKVNPIELSLKNGKIYSDKIELQNLKIISDIEDEAINGVTKAQIDINGVRYSISTQILLDILQGKDVKYQTGNVLKSNTKYKYEILFYDTANNEMKLKGNTGNTVTLKAAPTVNLRLKERDMVSNKISVQLVNEDDVNILDYRYELYDGTGKQIEKKNIDTSTKELLFNTLDPNKVYELKVKGNYDIEDGNGIQKNQEIGYLKFTTSPLGKLFIDIQCDEQDITDSTAKVKISVNDNTNSLLFPILQNIKIQIQRDDTKQIIEEVNLTGDEINEFAVEGLEKELNNLNSNTTYNVVVTGIAKQGSVTEEVAVELKGDKIFTTRKKPAEFITKEVLITNNMIELVTNLTDIDGACLNGIAKLRLKEAYDEQADDGDIISTMDINTNTDNLCTYNDLKEGKKYILECYIDEYNETNDENKITKKYFKVEYITGGLSGELSLKGITREKTENGKNLIDVESGNKWYSQCFGVLEKGYKVVDGNTVFDDIKSTKNYGKTASVGTNTSSLTLTSNQCYVYDFSKYKGKTVTMSFKAKVSSDSIKDNIYIQKGKSIGTNIEKIEGLTTVLGDRIIYTTKILDDGYLGFYLSANSKETLEINDLQVELGNKATDYEPFTYNVKVQAKANFEDKDFQTNEEEKEIGYFYVRLKKNGIIQKKNENGEYEDYIGSDYLGEKYGTDTYGDGDNTKAAVDLSYILNAETSAIYKLEIVITKYGREHILDELEFKYDPINCSEIKVIDNKKEFLNIQPRGNYFISKNIDLTEATEESQYTFGSPEIQFYGSIDFNGKTISKDMKDSDIENNKKYTPYLFYQIAENASLKNLVYDYYIKNANERANYINELDGIYGLFLYNNGNIDNLMFHLQNCTKNDKKYIGLVGYENKGVINKFIIKFDSKLYGSQYINGFCTKSYGTIQNGYIYGQGIETRGSITEFGSRNISGMIGTLMTGGSLRNVYNVSPIIINHITNTDSIAANMIYTAETGSNISNIYSTQEIKVNEGSTLHKKSLDKNQKEVNKGPNIYKGSGANSKFSYYFCSTTYENNDYNMKQSYTALNDYKFQDNLLNTDEAFEVKQYVENHYFPQLKLNKCMPYQETINIQEKNEIVLNIISTEKIEYKDIDTDKDIKDEKNIIANIKENVKNEIEKMNDHDGKEYEFTDNFDFNENNIQIIKLSVYNPNGYGFEEDDIKLKYVESKVIGLKRSDTMSILYLLLSNPTSYIDEYEIDSMTAKINQNGDKLEPPIQYGEGTELGKKTVKVSFTKHIYTTEEWHNIGVNDQNGISGLIQNYKLYNNLDFEGKCNSSTDSPYIMGAFKGTLDGQNYTLSNISDSQKSLFEQVAAGTKLENIKIENYKQSNSANAGVIGKIGSNNSDKQTLINNIHVNNIDLSGNNQYIGGLCGYMYTYNTHVQNCSVNGLTIKNLKNNGGYYIGGIIGYTIDEYNGNTVKYNNTTTYINNSYATNIDIDATDIQNSKTATIGGILGMCTYSFNNENNRKNIQYCYTQGKVLSKSPYIGGICGNGTATINVDNCYSLVDIETKQESGRTYIGGIIGNGAKTLSNNLYLGNIVAKYVSSYTNRIAGSGTQGANNYGYEKQLVNGNVSDTLYGAKGLLKYGEIFVKDTWISKLNMGDDKKYYNYEDLDSKWLPKICNTNGNILNEGNQPNIIFGEVMKASLASVAYSDKNETKVKITLSVDNVENVREDSLLVEIENMETETINLDKEKKIIEIIARPTKFYDSYVLKTITYSQDDSDTSTTLEVNFIISKSFYNTINSVSEWNENVTNDGENYKIASNLVFKDNNGNSLLTNYNKKIGRIISSDGQHKRIEGIDIVLNNSNSGFINQIVKELKNIDFSNCNITAKGNNGGLIYLNNGTINNCDFNNITIDGKDKDYIGIVARCSNFASMSNINLSQIDVKGRSYVGGLCGYIPISLVGGTLNTINANTQENNNISITATGSFVGGIVGYSGIEMKNMNLKSVNITGRDYTGGCAGRLDRTGNNVTVINSKIQGSSRATGACFGAKYYGYCMNIKSTRNEIYANQRIASSSSVQGVGGCVGFLYVNGSEGTIDSTDNKIYASGSNYVGGNMGVLWSYSWIIVRNITSTRNEVNGDSFVGGIIGEARHYYNNDGVGIIEKAYSTDNTINASGDNVGGCIGSSQLRMRNMKTIYTEKSNKPKINGKNCVGGITGKATYNCVSDSVSYYTINGAKVENANILGTGGYVGGISGNQMGTIYAAAVSNTTVNTTGNFAGGITGYYTASDKKNASYVASEKIYILHSFCSNSEINAASYAGGIVGKMVYGNVRYCYVGNTNVLASSNNAGGIVGYIENNKMTDKQYKAIIRYNYIVNTEENKMVMSNNIAGGIIGNIDLSYISREDVNDYNLIENYIANNLALTDINGIQVSMIIGFQSGKTEYTDEIKNTYVYKYSKINGQYVKDTTEGKKGIYQLVSSNELNDTTSTSIYVDTNKLSLGTTRFNYTTGIFPQLKTMSDNYWNASNLNVIQPSIQVPEDPDDTSTTSLLSNEMVGAMMLSNTNLELPELYTYAVDVDKINIEFSDINANMRFDIKTNEGKIVLESTSVDRKVYTLNYDFSTPLIVTVSNGTKWFTKEINQGDVQNLIQIIDNEYFYILENKLYSNKREFEGEYLNIYNGKGLTSSGKIYNILDMSLLGNLKKKIKVLNEEIPINETEYEGTNIKTFYHCSKISENNEEIYKDKQILIKNGMMYLVDGSLDSKGNSIIIDSYNENRYETILGTDGVIYDLLTKVKYPTNFKNKDIIAMNNNIDNNDEIMLVYYSNGRVYAFNYITGEEVFDNNIGKDDVRLVSYIIDNLDVTKTLYKTDKSSYAEAKELTSKLEAMPIESAVTEIKEGRKKNAKISKNKKDTNTKYVTAYNADTQTYSVYSAKEILGKETSKVISENDKINKDTDLVEYYENISTGTVKLKGIGITVFVITLTSICVILIVMNKKSRKLNK